MSKKIKKTKKLNKMMSQQLRKSAPKNDQLINFLHVKIQDKEDHQDLEKHSIKSQNRIKNKSKFN